LKNLRVITKSILLPVLQACKQFCVHVRVALQQRYRYLNNR